MSYQHSLSSSSSMKDVSPLGSISNVADPGFKLIPNRIFVGGMSRETTEEDLLRYFAAYGNVKSAKIITDINTNASKGYGFVTFGSEEEALRLQKFGGIAILHNRKLNIGPAIKRNVAVSQEQSVSTANSTNSVTPSQIPTNVTPKPSEMYNQMALAAAAGYSNGLFPSLSLDPTSASMLYQPFYGFPFSYFYPGSPAVPFQFPH